MREKFHCVLSVDLQFDIVYEVVFDGIWCLTYFGGVGVDSMHNSTGGLWRLQLFEDSDVPVSSDSNQCMRARYLYS